MSTKNIVMKWKNGLGFKYKGTVVMPEEFAIVVEQATSKTIKLGAKNDGQTIFLLEKEIEDLKTQLKESKDTLHRITNEEIQEGVLLDPIESSPNIKIKNIENMYVSIYPAGILNDENKEKEKE